MTYKMSLAMIVKDCAGGLDRVLSQAAKYFDEVVVVDTESTDGGATVAVAQKHGAKVLTYKRPEGFPWVDSFSAARNMSFDACSGDYICWLDSDDTVVGFDKLRDCIQQACEDTQPGADAVFVRYDYAFDEYGNCTTQLWRERIVRKGVFRWEAPLHEVLLPIGGRRFETAKLTGLGVPYVAHKGYVGKEAPEVEKKRLERNLAILDRWEATKADHLKEFEDNKLRMTMYKGNHLLGCGRHDEAIACYETYIKESGWPEEIYIALINMGRCFKGKALEVKDDESPTLLLKALTCYRDACFSIPDHYEAHANLADVYFILGEYDKAEYHAREALEAKSKRFIPVENPATRDILPIVVLQSLCFQQQRWADSLEWGKKAAIYLPDDKGVRDLLMKTQRMLADGEVYEAFKKVRVALEADNDAEKMRNLYKAIPSSISDLGDLAKYLRAPRPVDKKSIAIFCGPTVEEWSPDSLLAGIGGSEEAVIFMAYELRNLGYHVEVYNMPPMAQQGDVQGVQWLPHWAYDPETPADIFIAWRGHQYLQLGAGSSQRYLWLHDRQAEKMDPRTIEAADAIFVLSKSHRGDYGLSEVPEEKIHYTANGLSPRWLVEPANEPGQAVYASCPTRGLKTLLGLWGRIRDGVDAVLGAGKAQLHIYYGFSPLYDVHARQNPALKTLRSDIMELVKQPGVVWHGKVGQQELAKAWASSAAWLYPTEFPETSCAAEGTLVQLPCDRAKYPFGMPIEQLVGRENFPVYAYSAEEERFVLANCTKAWKTGEDRECVDIELDDGSVLTVTPEHQVMDFDGDWHRADSLKPGMRLNALHMRYNVAYKDIDGDWRDEHRLVGEWQEGRALRADEHVNHKNATRLDNRPEMLEVMSSGDHARLTHSAKGPRRKKSMAKQIAGFKKWAATPEAQAHFKTHLGKAGRGLWAKVRGMPEDERRAWCAERARRRVASQVANSEGRWNHKVVAVRPSTKRHTVYDMEVDKHHNFVAGGVVIHNCITAMRAQASGCFPVTSGFAALSETCAKWDRGPTHETDLITADPARLDAFVEAAIAAMTETRTARRLEMSTWAKDRFSWAAVANDWHQSLFSAASPSQAPAAALEPSLASS